MEPRGGCFTFSCILWPWPFSLLLPLLLFSSRGLSASLSDARSADHLALLSFKSFVYDDPSKALASWNSSLHFCQWQGVRCHNRSGEPRVTALELVSLHLAGALSPSLANLTFLRRLDLSTNSLQGPIPQELGLLSHLRHLRLDNNSLDGTIPLSLFQNCSKLQTFNLRLNNLIGAVPRNLSDCLELQIIRLDNNGLEGEIPSDLGSLSKLSWLDLWSNSLAGSIPPQIGNLASLTLLSLAGNNLNGPIPAAIGNLSSLSQLVLSNSQLTGAIPATIGNLSSLTWLDLSNNSLAGAIPPEIGNLVHLGYLDLHINHLNGTIPSEIGNLVNLTALFLGGNQLSGTIPISLGHLQSLKTLILTSNKLEARNAAEWSFLDALTNCTRFAVLGIAYNNLGGMLPKSIANLSTTLIWLNLFDNQIYGSIPAEIGNLINLNTIGMWSNLLSGTIPASLGSLVRLETLKLGANKLVGEIPVTLGNLTRLSSLSLASNELYGSIPSTLGKCPLETLDLASNKLNGTVPKDIMFIPTFNKYLNVSHNSLSGFLPLEIGKLINIQTIDVSDNRLSGGVPSTISECEVLENLYMQGNLFQGSIPSSLNQLKGLQVLDLSSNNLSGQIPNFHNMTYLNLSYNNLDGEVPKVGVFSNASAFSVAGNNNLCGGVRELGLRPCPDQASKKKHLSGKLIAVILLAAGILCVIFLLSLFAARWWFHKSRTHSPVASCIKEQHRKVSFAELLRATDGFSPANLIGMGSFGSVYKGTMDWEDHKVVAVKVLNLLQRGASRSFTAECEALRNIRHRNLVKVLTSCSGVDFRGNDFKALVFELLPNGSLDKWLHPEADERGTSRTLSLIQRMNISIDVASALGYLHHHGPTPIVHCDLKPSNILLDHDMVAHVGDFGLARFLRRTVSKSFQRSTNSVTLKGSIGYAAPEYGMANKVSVQGDAYSFGILLLEMFTGKRPTDDSLEGLNLHQYVEMAVPEKVVEIIDPCLLSEEGETEAEADRTNPSTSEFSTRALECITSVLRVGILCSKESPKERMHMEHVIRELHDIRDAIL
ncbi:probable LRR receptor-like serine/threonine-protein kinase At3g47570 [Musa acuminata AAA Group]|uniref:probable LRR receptor-like serine/threonine-protein kinase At3g47570 n=1 Tax=Musa acuminata AAA Group TaxID=214697 RepID=UPI0031E0C583